MSLYFIISIEFFASLFYEISGKAQKSLITPLPAGRQGLKKDYTDFRKRKIFFQSSLL